MVELLSADDLMLKEFEAHIAVATAAKNCLSAEFARLVEAAMGSVRTGGKIILFGNGGSAADAQHWATELTVRFREMRRPISALALTTDSSALTAIGNDFGFDRVFSRQVEALGRQTDLVIGISTSGSSENVLNGIRAAKQLGCTTAGFTGNGGGLLASSVDIALVVPSNDTARIQEIHAVLGHAFCASVEQRVVFESSEP